jgi:hypothetical protein
MSHKPAAGLHSRDVRHVDAPKAEPKPRAISKDAVSQIGLKTAYLKDELVRGRGYATPKGPTDNVKAVGVGGGRTIHQSGSQHGLTTRQISEGKDILSNFGPEATPRHNR